MKSSSITVAAGKIKKLTRLRPALALVLGSGFDSVLRHVEVETSVPYSSIPGFPPMGVKGHRGELYSGRLNGTPLFVLSGRAHFYEAHPMERVTFAVRTLAELGVRDLLLTNAAGGINRRFRAGDFMVFADHINLMGANPLCGPEVPGRCRFVDLTRVYDPAMTQLLLKAGRACGAKLHRGVYVAVCGPSYETPAEIRAFARLGADAVGMSTVPEAIVARQCGLNVAALSCITNLAAGLAGKPLSHDEVLRIGANGKTQGAALVKEFAGLYAWRK